MSIAIDRIDHIVVTAWDVDRTIDFYQRVLGMEPVTFAGGRRALAFGRQKINLHQAGAEFEPKAEKPTPGSGDFCLITEVPLEGVVEHLRSRGVEIIDGPVARTGATSRLESVYFRDPDGNLVEVSNLVDSAG
jgi:catechol 2,3-dioxygenase-like lactoylglutathione lyase family enzyme